MDDYGDKAGVELIVHGLPAPLVIVFALWFVLIGLPATFIVLCNVVSRVLCPGTPDIVIHMPPRTKQSVAKQIAQQQAYIDRLQAEMDRLPDEPAQ